MFLWLKTAIGVQIFLSTVDNSPRGDSDFWQKALFHHMGPYYVKSIERTVAVGDSNFFGRRIPQQGPDSVQILCRGLCGRSKKFISWKYFPPDGTADFTSIYKAFAEGDLK